MPQPQTRQVGHAIARLARALPPELSPSFMSKNPRKNLISRKNLTTGIETYDGNALWLLVLTTEMPQLYTRQVGHAIARLARALPPELSPSFAGDFHAPARMLNRLSGVHSFLLAHASALQVTVLVTKEHFRSKY